MEKPDRSLVETGDERRPSEAERHSARPDDPDIDWRDRALRLQAEMENFRKRQQRLAQEEIDAERQRLLSSFVRVIDDLERALKMSGDGHGLREGLQLTHRSAFQMLSREGVERVEGVDEPFDPTWQEAVSTVDHRQARVPPNTVVQTLSPGYRRGEQLLRPARVIVAV